MYTRLMWDKSIFLYHIIGHFLSPLETNVSQLDRTLANYIQVNAAKSKQCVFAEMGVSVTHRHTQITIDTVDDFFIN